MRAFTITGRLGYFDRSSESTYPIGYVGIYRLGIGETNGAGCPYGSAHIDAREIGGGIHGQRSGRLTGNGLGRVPQNAPVNVITQGLADNGALGLALDVDRELFTAPLTPQGYIGEVPDRCFTTPGEVSLPGGRQITPKI